MMSGTSGFGMGGGFGMLIFWIVILALVFFGVRGIMSSSSNRQKHVESNDAMRILESRYAKGEIDRSEFEEKKRDLQRH